MSQNGCRDRTWPPVTRTVPDLRIANYDRMQRDVTVEITNDSGETVFTENRSIVRGGDLTHRSVFRIAGSYHVSASLRYGTAITATYPITPGQTGIRLDIHPDGIDAYSVSQ
jgi:hypothetical protein